MGREVMKIRSGKLKWRLKNNRKDQPNQNLVFEKINKINRTLDRLQRKQKKTQIQSETEKETLKLIQ